MHGPLHRSVRKLDEEQHKEAEPFPRYASRHIANLVSLGPVLAEILFVVLRAEDAEEAGPPEERTQAEEEKDYEEE